MTDIARAYDRIAKAALQVGASIERMAGFARSRQGPLTCLTAGGQAGEAAVICKGEGNSLWRGHGSGIVRSRIEIMGNDNIVFLGGFSQLRLSEIRLKGNGGLFFFGPLSTTGSILCIVKNGRQIVVGEDCMFSTDITIETSDHHGIYDAGSGLRLNLEADIVIHAHVWIGRRVSIAKGSVIGANSVIGQNSVVTGTTASGCVHAGVPARCVRSGIAWSRGSADTLEAAAGTPAIRTLDGRRRDYLAHLSR